ncbi:response regulator [Chitinasiproducens palmae]|uniref:DNA-binding response regulator, NarL/FixJ family, contains REC and HTH domains n=1 Tax=Chitinasiproducens palmae TaxID=1770053 RepID=A0A1H2PNZ2_9BURK|nr:response regulator transcription factor [Chitinasiproducens palmae]SDV48447.1 DNA-binding response regulator, NarL/FixJ family, contains REC and HTH domains [Chitinasiproducens palmae]
MIRILIADDHALVREGLAHILRRGQDFELIGEAADGDAVIRLVRSDSGAAADILLLDLSMPGKSGIELIKQVRRERPALRILVLTMHAEQQYAVRAFKAGAAGYLTKESAAAELVDAVRRVAGGQTFVSQTIASALAEALQRAGDAAPHEALSDREMEVYRRLVAGETVSSIAGTLFLSPKTVSTYKTRLAEKLGVENDAALIRYAIANRLFDA